MRRRRAQRAHRVHPGAIHDSARGDHRHGCHARYHAGQGDCAEPCVGAIGVEHAAMAARFPALRHQHIDPRADRGARLGRVGHRGEQGDPGGLQRGDARCIGQAEMQADHRGPLGQQQRQHGIIIGKAAVERGQPFGRGGTEAIEFGAPALDPRRLARRIGRGHGVDEQVHVERPVGARAQIADLPCRSFGITGAQRDRAEPAGLGHGGGQRRARDPGHRCLHDRQRDPRQDHAVCAQAALPSCAARKSISTRTRAGRCRPGGVTRCSAISGMRQSGSTSTKVPAAR